MKRGQKLYDNRTKTEYWEWLTVFLLQCGRIINFFKLIVFIDV